MAPEGNPVAVAAWMLVEQAMPRGLAVQVLCHLVVADFLPQSGDSAAVPEPHQEPWGGPAPPGQRHPRWVPGSLSSHLATLNPRHLFDLGE